MFRESTSLARVPCAPIQPTLPSRRVLPQQALYRSDSVQMGRFDGPLQHLEGRSSPVPSCFIAFPEPSLVDSTGRTLERIVDTNSALIHIRGRTKSSHASLLVGGRFFWLSATAPALRRARRELCTPERFRDQRLSRGTTVVVPLPTESFVAQRSLFQHLANGACATFTIEKAAISLLSRVLPHQPLTNVDLSRRSEGAVHVAKQFIVENYRESVSIAQIARNVRLSRAHLSRAFQRETSLTPHAYRNSLRLRAAFDALTAGVKDITELAMDLGYASHSHFSASFRATFGVTPSSVRAGLAHPDQC